MHHSSAPCACTSLRKASRALTRLYDEQLAAHGMTTTQFAILRHLARDGELGLSRLAERLVMDRTSLYRTLAPIERAGWVRIETADRRSKAARLTEAGAAALHAAEGSWAAAQDRVLAELEGGEWQALITTLNRLTGLAPA